MADDDNSSKWIRLNVGGKTFQTTKLTLRKYPESFLARLCDIEGMLPGDKDENGALLIDRDPKYFRLILNYLRNGSLDQDPTLPLEGTLKEAEFYGLEELVEEIKNAVEEHQRKKLVTRECVTVSCIEARSHQAQLIFDRDVSEDHFLVAELNLRSPFSGVYKKTKGLFVGNMSPESYTQLATQAATILCAHGFKLDARMSDAKWIFVKDS
ncbi:BTB/POZ domain-containing protein KCTD5-like protein [Aphelenchoides avenae]|nr:BTB/POZ domain-containing protein KCTD5-like protein [Aphelenchus avenae]